MCTLSRLELQISTGLMTVYYCDENKDDEMDGICLHMGEMRSTHKMF